MSFKCDFLEGRFLCETNERILISENHMNLKCRYKKSRQFSQITSQGTQLFMIPKRFQITILEGSNKVWTIIPINCRMCIDGFQYHDARFYKQTCMTIFLCPLFFQSKIHNRRGIQSNLTSNNRWDQIKLASCLIS